MAKCVIMRSFSQFPMYHYRRLQRGKQFHLPHLLLFNLHSVWKDGNSISTLNVDEKSTFTDANMNVVPAIFIYADGNMCHLFALIKESEWTRRSLLETSVWPWRVGVTWASAPHSRGQHKQRLGESTVCLSFTATRWASTPQQKGIKYRPAFMTD